MSALLSPQSIAIAALLAAGGGYVIGGGDLIEREIDFLRGKITTKSAVKSHEQTSHTEETLGKEFKLIIRTLSSETSSDADILKYETPLSPFETQYDSRLGKGKLDLSHMLRSIIAPSAKPRIEGSLEFLDPFKKLNWVSSAYKARASEGTAESKPKASDELTLARNLGKSNSSGGKNTSDKLSSYDDSTKQKFESTGQQTISSSLGKKVDSQGIASTNNISNRSLHSFQATLSQPQTNQRGQSVAAVAVGHYALPRFVSHDWPVYRKRQGAQSTPAHRKLASYSVPGVLPLRPSMTSAAVTFAVDFEETVMTPSRGHSYSVTSTPAPQPLQALTHSGQPLQNSYETLSPQSRRRALSAPAQLPGMSSFSAVPSIAISRVGVSQIASLTQTSTANPIPLNVSNISSTPQILNFSTIGSAQGYLTYPPLVSQGNQTVSQSGTVSPLINDNMTEISYTEIDSPQPIEVTFDRVGLQSPAYLGFEEVVLPAPYSLEVTSFPEQTSSQKRSEDLGIEYIATEEFIEGQNSDTFVPPIAEASSLESSTLRPAIAQQAASLEANQDSSQAAEHETLPTVVASNYTEGTETSNPQQAEIVTQTEPQNVTKVSINLPPLKVATEEKIEEPELISKVETGEDEKVSIIEESMITIPLAQKSVAVEDNQDASQTAEREIQPTLSTSQYTESTVTLPSQHGVVLTQAERSQASEGPIKPSAQKTVTETLIGEPKVNTLETEEGTKVSNIEESQNDASVIRNGVVVRDDKDSSQTAEHETLQTVIGSNYTESRETSNPQQPALVTQSEQPKVVEESVNISAQKVATEEPIEDPEVKTLEIEVGAKGSAVEYSLNAPSVAEESVFLEENNDSSKTGELLGQPKPLENVYSESTDTSSPQQVATLTQAEQPKVTDESVNPPAQKVATEQLIEEPKANSIETEEVGKGALVEDFSNTPSVAEQSVFVEENKDSSKTGELLGQPKPLENVYTESTETSSPQQVASVTQSEQPKTIEESVNPPLLKAATEESIKGPEAYLTETGEGTKVSSTEESTNTIPEQSKALAREENDDSSQVAKLNGQHEPIEDDSTSFLFSISPDLFIEAASKDSNDEYLGDNFAQKFEELKVNSLSRIKTYFSLLNRFPDIFSYKDNIKENIESLASQIDVIDKNISETILNLTGLKQEQQKVADTISEIESIYKNFISQITDLMYKSIDKIQEELDAKIKNYNDWNASYKNSGSMLSPDEIEDLKLFIETLQINYKNKSQEFNDIESSITAMKSRKSVINTLKDELYKEIEDQISKNETLKSDNQYWEGKQKQIEQWAAEYNTLNDRLGRAQAESENYKEQLRQLKTLIEEKEAELEAYYSIGVTQNRPDVDNQVEQVYLSEIHEFEDKLKSFKSKYNQILNFDSINKTIEKYGEFEAFVTDLAHLANHAIAKIINDSDTLLSKIKDLSYQANSNQAIVDQEQMLRRLNKDFEELKNDQFQASNVREILKLFDKAAENKSHEEIFLNHLEEMLGNPLTLTSVSYRDKQAQESKLLRFMDDFDGNASGEIADEILQAKDYIRSKLGLSIREDDE